MVKNDDKVNIWFFDVDFTLLSDAFYITSPNMSPIIGDEKEMEEYFKHGDTYSYCGHFRALQTLITNLLRITPVYALTVCFSKVEYNRKSSMVTQGYDLTDVIAVASKDEKIEYLINYKEENKIANPILIDDDLYTVIAARKAGIEAYSTTNLFFYLYEIRNGKDFTGSEFLHMWRSRDVYARYMKEYYERTPSVEATFLEESSNIMY